MAVQNSGHFPTPGSSGIPPHFNASGAKGASEVVFEIKKKRVDIKKSKIKEIALGLAEVAYSLGETNDVEEFANDMTENIFEAMKKVKEKKKNQRQ